MFNKTTIALAVALVLSYGVAALAGGKDDDGAGHDRWEGKIGPSGQVFSGGQVQSGLIGQASNAFAQASTSQTKQKDSKQAKKASTNSTRETEEEARKRHYEDNR